MPVFKLYLTDRGVKVATIMITAVVIILLALWFHKIASLDKVEIIKPLEEMQYVDKVWDDGECYYIFKYKEDRDRWYRLITVDNSRGKRISFISYYPTIIDYGDDLLIRVRWDPNKYVDCETFLRIAKKYNGLVGKGEAAFCQRYHLPLNKIKTVCGEF